MPAKYILALDQGTTSSRAIVFDRRGRMVALAQKEFRQYYPAPAWVEHDANEIWATQAGVAAEALTSAGLKARDIAAIGITNQRETTVVWDRKTGQPICPAIVWQDRRTARHCDALRKDQLAPMIRRKTGLVIDAYFSATKLHWILRKVPGARRRARDGQLAFGTVDSWLLWKMTEGRCHMTDATNASRTMLFDIKKRQWDRELLELFEVPEAVLPRAVSSSEFYGETSFLGDPIPVAGMAGDQHAALFGQRCTQPGLVKNTYGTGCFLLMNTGQKPVASKSALVTTIAWQLAGRTEYALEGSIFIAGAVVQWLRDGLKMIRTSSDVEELAGSVADNGGVYFAPAFAGLGAPYWDAYARGTICGLTRGSSAGHIARAALESMAFQTADVIQAMEKDAGITLRELRVDGGATVNRLLMQIQADLLNVPVIRPRVAETTALGAAFLAGLATAYWKGEGELEKLWKAEQTFKPKLKGSVRKELLRNWAKVTARARRWAEDSYGEKG